MTNPAINDIDLSTLDLNLLLALEALLSEASVTRASRRLHIGQPAASHALARLRDLFGDALLVRSGRTMTRTPRAERLLVPLQRILADIHRLVRSDTDFDPTTTTRTFRIMAPDVLAPILPVIFRSVSDLAPKARLEIVRRHRSESAALEDDLAELALIPTLDQGTGLRTRGLGRVRFSVVARAGHPAVGARKRIGKTAWLKFPHVMVRSGGQSRSVVGIALEKAGLTRHVGLVVPSFLAAMVTVAETDLLFAAPRKLTMPLAEKLNLVLLSLPITVPELPVAAVWHDRYQDEPSHQFFRNAIISVVASALR